MDPFKVVLFPDQVLLRQTKEANERKIRSGSYEELVDRMILTMREHDGLGIAAPQVGLGLSLFVMETIGRNSDQVGAPPIVAFNPRLHSPKGAEEGDEGCLSLPGIIAPILRPSEVTLEASGRDGKRFSITLSGMGARAAAHEFDHLHGIIFLQRATELVALRLYRHLSSLKKTTGD
jgi:peptide deformylase